MLTYFQNSFSVALGSKFAVKSCVNISPHLRHVTTLPCEISMLKNRHDQGVIEANCCVRLGPQNCWSVVDGASLSVSRN